MFRFIVLRIHISSVLPGSTLSARTGNVKYPTDLHTFFAPSSKTSFVVLAPSLVAEPYVVVYSIQVLFIASMILTVGMNPLGREKNDDGLQ